MTPFSTAAADASPRPGANASDVAMMSTADRSDGVPGTVGSAAAVDCSACAESARTRATSRRPAARGEALAWRRRPEAGRDAAGPRLALALRARDEPPLPSCPLRGSPAASSSRSISGLAFGMASPPGPSGSTSVSTTRPAPSSTGERAGAAPRASPKLLTITYTFPAPKRSRSAAGSANSARPFGAGSRAPSARLLKKFSRVRDPASCGRISSGRVAR